MTEFLKTKKEIIAWLEKHQIDRYQLKRDEKYGYVVNVRGNVDLSGRKLNHIPLKNEC